MWYEYVMNAKASFGNKKSNDTKTKLTEFFTFLKYIFILQINGFPFDLDKGN